LNVAREFYLGLFGLHSSQLVLMPADGGARHRPVACPLPVRLLLLRRELLLLRRRDLMC
jgi:hypothetical protein